MKKIDPDYLMLLGAITQMSKEDQEEIQRLKKGLQDVLETNKDHGVIALTIIGMEMQFGS